MIAWKEQPFVDDGLEQKMWEYDQEQFWPTGLKEEEVDKCFTGKRSKKESKPKIIGLEQVRKYSESLYNSPIEEPCFWKQLKMDSPRPAESLLASPYIDYYREESPESQGERPFDNDPWKVE